MARYTKQILTKALRELLREKKVNDITIHDLTDRAQVNRKTFYYHYHTLSDLLNEMCTESVHRIIGDEPIGPDNWQEKAEQLLYFVMEERHDMLAILSSVYARDYTAHIEELAENIVSEFIHSAIRTYESAHGVTLLLRDQQIEYINEYYSMALYGMVKIWFTRGMKETPEEVVHNISLLTRDHMYSTFEQMDRENRTAGGKLAG